MFASEHTTCSLERKHCLFASIYLSSCPNFQIFHRYSITSHLKKHLFRGGGGFGKENRSSSKNRNWKQPWIYITNDVVAKTVHPLKKRNNQQTENFGGWFTHDFILFFFNMFNNQQLPSSFHQTIR